MRKTRRATALIPVLLIILSTNARAARVQATMNATPAHASGLQVFNVRDYGATGRKADNAQAAIQRAVDACGAAGGGLVYLPPGDYTSGTIHLRSHIRLFVEAGATLWSIKQKAAFDKDSLLYGEDLVDVTIE
ncbi:MAG TPA: glycosyl hydrolase family 28-related protein, partial [Burkholderiales bacterium]|nr:glycosyl hydrolase family 28-related protein [Burkholderiales bacterium]